MDEEAAEERRPAGTRFDALQEFMARVAPTGPLNTAELDDATAEVLAALETAGVDALLLKGRALAILLYGARDRRAYSDIDLLVAPGKFADAEVVLARLGYVDAGADDGIDDIGGVVHAQTWVRASPGSSDPPMVDLHRWLPGSRAEPSVAWGALTARSMWIEVGGRQTAVLDRSGQAMHLATHAAQHGPSSEKQVSELQLALKLWPDEVWDAATVLATEIGASEMFAAGLRLTPQGAAQAARIGLDPTDELDWKIRHGHERPRGVFHLQALAEAKSLGSCLGVAQRSLFPARAWIIHQHPWAGRGRLGIATAYGLHLARSPIWAARALIFRERARRAGRPR